MGISAQEYHLPAPSPCTDLPSSLSFLGPYLSMTMPRGRVIALSRKEPTVNAKLSISSWALQLRQTFIKLISSDSCSGSAVPPTVALVTVSVCVEGGILDHRVEAGIPKDRRGSCTFRPHWKCQVYPGMALATPGRLD